MSSCGMHRITHFDESSQTINETHACGRLDMKLTIFKVSTSRHCSTPRRLLEYHYGVPHGPRVRMKRVSLSVTDSVSDMVALDH
jgi:hypothetical protein